ncbi:MAG: hypothetical protein ACC682_16250 [Gemmatimonadota bacterium]
MREIEVLAQFAENVIMPGAGRPTSVALVLVCWIVATGAASQDSGDWSIDPEPSVRVGWITDQPETEFFGVVAAVRLPDGAIAIADRGLAKVTLVEADGSVRFAVGGSGDGPGEFAGLAQVLVDDRGHIYAFDARHQRLTEWTGAGVLVGTTTLSRAAAGRGLGSVGRFESGAWYVREAPRLASTRVGEMAQDTVGYFRFDEDGIVGAKIADVPGAVATLVMVRGQPATRDIMFSPRALGTRVGDCLVVMTSDAPRLRVIDSAGGLRDVISLPVPVRRTSATDRQSWIDGVIEANDVPPEAAAMIEEMGRELVMAERWPIANRIIADDAGYVWMERYEAPEGPSGSWIVVDGTGDVVAEPALPDGLRLLDVVGDHVIGVWSDDLDRQEVRVHTLKRDLSGRETRPVECR